MVTRHGALRHSLRRRERERESNAKADMFAVAKSDLRFLARSAASQDRFLTEKMLRIGSIFSAHRSGRATVDVFAAPVECARDSLDRDQHVGRAQLNTKSARLHRGRRALGRVRRVF
jgi:hypothetical protein